MIKTHNLLIRKFKETDWKDLHEYLSLEEIYIFEPGKPVTEAEAKKITAARAYGNDFYAVVLKNVNKMIGHLYFHHQEPEEFLTWELGYIFNPRYQNHGFCSEASKQIIKYGFDNLNTHKVVSFCNPDNIASWKVSEKIGMEREGLLKEKAFFHRDENNQPLWHDCCVYGILNKK